MTIEQLDVVDIASVDPKSEKVVLTISDHLDWDDTTAHQLALQRKINKYLAFVESGEILARYPPAEGRAVVINIYMKYEPDRAGLQFLEKVRTTLLDAGFGFEYQVHSLEGE